MSNRRTEIQAKSSRDGNHLQVTAQETDSPILPVAQLKSLHEFRPDLVDWVVQRTDAEAEDRRARQRRLDKYVFSERLLGLFGGIFIALAGFATSTYLATHGAETAATVIGSGTLVSIVSIIVTGRKRLTDKLATADSAVQKKKS